MHIYNKKRFFTALSVVAAVVITAVLVAIDATKAKSETPEIEEDATDNDEN